MERRRLNPNTAHKKYTIGSLFLKNNTLDVLLIVWCNLQGLKYEVHLNLEVALCRFKIKRTFVEDGIKKNSNQQLYIKNINVSRYFESSFTLRRKNFSICTV